MCKLQQFVKIAKIISTIQENGIEFKGLNDDDLIVTQHKDNPKFKIKQSIDLWLDIDIDEVIRHLIEAHTNMLNVEENYVLEICKLGEKDCCRYLSRDGNGYCCEKKYPDRKAYLDKMVEDKKVFAAGDNCEGKEDSFLHQFGDFVILVHNENK